MVGATTGLRQAGDRLLISVKLYTILDPRTGGELIEYFAERDDAARFVAEVERDEPDLAGVLEVVELELDTSPN
jgi:hypothetical protein